MKQQIKLNEGQLRQIIKESVKKVLTEFHVSTRGTETINDYSDYEDWARSERWSNPSNSKKIENPYIEKYVIGIQQMLESAIRRRTGIEISIEAHEDNYTKRCSNYWDNGSMQNISDTTNTVIFDIGCYVPTADFHKYFIMIYNIVSKIFKHSSVVLQYNIKLGDIEDQKIVKFDVFNESKLLQITVEAYVIPDKNGRDIARKLPRWNDDCGTFAYSHYGREPSKYGVFE